ncbi:YggT family protein [Candidatus Peregrinibacteria bacterium]|nr:YggT family protein [Candidatus Peregrinibacteria bacterium]
MNIVNVLNFAANFVVILSEVLVYAIIARVIVSWVNMGKPPSTLGPISRGINDATQPIIDFIRKFPHRIGMIDLSPIIAIIGIQVLAKFILLLIYNLA